MSVQVLRRYVIQRFFYKNFCVQNFNRKFVQMCLPPLMIVPVSYYSTNPKYVKKMRENREKWPNYEKQSKDYFEPLENGFLLGLIDVKQQDVDNLPIAIKRLITLFDNDPKSLLEEENHELIADVTNLVGTLDKPTVVLLFKKLVNMPQTKPLDFLRTTMDQFVSETLRDHRKFDNNTLGTYLDMAIQIMEANSSVGKKINFLQLLTRVCFHNVGNLEKENFKKFLYLLNIKRSSFNIEYQSQLEESLKTNLSTMNSDEIGLACAALFKTKTAIKDIEIIELIVKHFDPMKAFPISISAVFKMLRLSKDYAKKSPDNLREFILKCIESSDKFPTMTLAHLCLLSSYYLVGSEPLLSKSLERVCNDKTTRLKDVISIMRTCSEFNFAPTKQQFETLTDNLVNTAQLRQHPDKVSALLSLFASFHHYPETLLKYFYGPSYEKAIKSNS